MSLSAKVTLNDSSTVAVSKFVGFKELTGPKKKGCVGVGRQASSLLAAFSATLGSLVWPAGANLSRDWPRLPSREYMALRLGTVLPSPLWRVRGLYSFSLTFSPVFCHCIALW